jgi:aryl-alcohol dehydrogenase-like predicted oxidoreductase
LKLGLGTVQFGLDYGISNHHGKTSLSEATNILQVAKSSGIDLLDTASLYGDSEAVIGKTMHGQNFQVVTKTPQFKLPQIKKEHATQLKQAFNNSTDKLHVDSVYGLLMHQAEDLLADGGEYLMEALIEIKETGGTQKIGVSVYNQEQIERVLNRYQVDLIQLPLNVFDQSLAINGCLKELKKNNVEIHVRSIFLQGLLLTEIDKIRQYFNKFKPQIKQYQSVLDDYGLSLLQGALAYIKSIREVDYAIVGVNSSRELVEITNAVDTLPNEFPNFDNFYSNDQRLVNPLVWLAEGVRGTQ